MGDEEIAEVADTLRSGWLTRGPKVARFEQAFAEYVGARHAVAVNSCTSGLQLSLAVLGVGPGDEVIVPTMTFCSTANVVKHLGATPVLVDTDEDLLLNADIFRGAITSRTKAVMPVHYAGHPCELDALREVAARHGIHVVEDAAHAAGAEYKKRKIGSGAEAAVFSFSATKNLSTGEGGMIATDDDEIAARCRLLSLHGISRDTWNRHSSPNGWHYEVLEAGFKFNMTDVQAAIGIHQLAKLEGFNAARTAIADRYDAALAGIPGLLLPRRPADGKHSFYIYPVHLRPEAKLDRDGFVAGLRDLNIGSSVHFIPLHRHPLYSAYRAGDFPVCERIFEGLLSLPLYPGMRDQDVDDVVHGVQSLLC